MTEDMVGEPQIAQEAPRRGRPPKVAEVRRERRRKDGDAENASLRLTIPDWVYEKYPKRDFKLRWVTDDPARMHQKHAEDWDPVEGVDPVPGAYDRNDRPANHILCFKPMEWVMDDRAKLEERRKQIERQAEQGHVTARGDDAGQTLDETVSYAGGSNRLR